MSKKNLIILAAVVIIVIAGYFIFAKKSQAPSAPMTGMSQSQVASNNRTPPAENKADQSGVTINNFSFNPATLTIKAGTTVTWTNNDSVPHTITSDTNAFGSNNLGNGQTFSFTFKTPGTYNYHCSIHTFMKAAVIVQ